MHGAGSPRRVSIRVSLVALIAVCIFLSSGLTLWLTFDAARVSLRSLLEELMFTVESSFRTRAAYTFKEAETTLAIMDGLHTNGMLDPEAPGRIDRFIKPVMQAHPFFSSITIADRRGGYSLFTRLPDGSISREGDGDHKVANASYDPRTRPWYRQALERRSLSWTNAYFHQTDQRPAVTCSIPLYDGDTALPSSVVAISIGLEDLSRFLGALPDSLTVFILEGADKVVALPLRSTDPVSPLFMTPLDSAPVLPSITQIPRFGALHRAFSLARQLETLSPTAQGGCVEFILDGTLYVGLSRSIREESPWDWTIYVVVPETIFMQKIQERIVIAVLLSGLIIVAALFFGAILAGRLSRPLAALSRDMDRVEHFELDGDAPPGSVIREVDQIARSYTRMKAGLRSFRKYVPADLVRQLIRIGKEARLGGEKRELTIYFSDIAGFTTISESLTPEALVEHLSEYFEEVGQIVASCHGTVDKYIGDAVMAFWNAPEFRTDHAELACRTAIRVRSKLDELNRRWTAEGKPALTTRIGINTGEVIVGNMGSAKRLNYTALGDAVNLASRLEGINKLYGTEIIVSEKTMEKVKDKFTFRLLDHVIVKGKTLPVGIYELLGEEGSPESAVRAATVDYEEALRLYRDRRWDEATARFESVLARGEDGAARLFLKRCRERAAQPPPPADWNGAHEMDSK